MRIVITADHHLTTREKHPARYETLETILDDLCVQEIDTLIIAGDLFDAQSRNYSEFEQLCRSEKYRGLAIYVIPGNHDPTIDNTQIVAGNVYILNKPTIHEFDGRPFLFLPYEADISMGEVLSKFDGQLPPNEWILVGHGDWAGGLSQPNPIEPGVYMPLTQRDIEIFQPARVFLGHIHLPMDASPVHYAGSPCGLDITETGRRRCLLYETRSNKVRNQEVSAPILYYDESYVVIPSADEAGYLRKQIENRLQQWALTPQEREKVRLRVRLQGYSANRATLRDVLQEAYAGFTFYKNQEPDIDQVSISDDIERHYITQQVQSSLNDLSLSTDRDDPSIDEILIAALHIIYGG